MLDREYIMDIYKSVKRSIEAVTRNPKMFKFVRSHLKTKKMCVSMHLKKLPSL